MPRKSIETIWARILPYPIGTRVKYMRAQCHCEHCSVVPWLGKKGIIIEYIKEPDKKRLKKIYPDLDIHEVVYQVRFDDKNHCFPLRHFELEVVESV